MPRPRIILGLGVMLLTATAQAQRLNLGGYDAPDLGNTSVVDTVSGLLDEQIAEWAERLDAAESRDAGEHELVSLRLVLAWKQLARRLLSLESHADPEVASVATMHGLTLAGHTDLVQELATWYRNASRDAAEGRNAARWRRARSSILSFEFAVRKSNDPPQSLEDLDRDLRRTLGSLLNASLELPGAPTEPWLAWPSDGGLHEPPQPVPTRVFDGDLARELDDLLQRLNDSTGHHFYGQHCAYLLELVTQNIEGVNRLDDHAWTSPEVRTLMRSEVRKALERFVQPEQLIAATDDLATLAEAFDLLNTCSGIDFRQTHPPRVADLRTAIQEVILRLGSPVARRQGLRGAGTVQRIMHVAADYRELPSQNDAPWNVRSIRRPLDRVYLDIEGSLFGDLPELVREPDRLHTPDVVSIIARHQDACAAIEMTVRIPEVVRSLVDSGPPAAEAGARLESLATQLEDEMTRVESLGVIRSFLSQHKSLNPLPGEAILAAETSGVRLILGDRAPELLRVMIRERGAWYAAWAGSEDLTAVNRRLEVLRRLGTLLELHERMTVDESFQAGWLAPLEFSNGFIPALTARLPQSLEESIELAFDGRDALALDALVFAERGIAPLAAAERFEQLTLGMSLPEERVLASLIVELCQLPPRNLSALPSREQMARFSRWTFEWTHASRSGRMVLADEILTYLGEEAAAFPGP